MEAKTNFDPKFFKLVVIHVVVAPPGWSVSASCIKLKVKVSWSLHFLFYALPPNSQLLFSEPGIRPFFDDFDEPVGLRGYAVAKRCRTTNVNV